MILVDPVPDPVDDREPLKSSDDALDGVLLDADADDDACEDAGRMKVSSGSSSSGLRGFEEEALFVDDMLY